MVLRGEVNSNADVVVCLGDDTEQVDHIHYQVHNIQCDSGPQKEHIVAHMKWLFALNDNNNNNNNNIVYFNQGHMMLC